MNLEIGTEAAQFPEKECINGIFFTVYCKPSYDGSIRGGRHHLGHHVHEEGQGHQDGDP